MDVAGVSFDPWVLTDAEADALDMAGEHFAAGFLSALPTCAPHPRTITDEAIARHARGILRHLRGCALRPYGGEPLYPVGGSIWSPDRDILGDPTLPEPVLNLTAYYVALDICLNADAAGRRAAEARNDVERSAFGKLAAFCREMPRGGGWTHSIIHFERILAEGLELYQARILRHAAMAGDPHQRILYEAMLIVLQALRDYRDRVAELLQQARTSSPEAERNRLRLLSAYEEGIPFRAPGSFFDAMASVTLLYAFDGSDDLGRFDQYMEPFYARALASGEMTRDEAVDLIRALWRYVDSCSGWNVALGGSTRSGDAAYSDLTIACMEAAQGMRRPNLALRLRHDTPDRVWDAALATVASGAGLPALYCEENYLAAIDAAHLNISDEDKRDFAFGGCTELMVQGCSNVGSLDGDFSVIRTLEETLHRSLGSCATFEEFVAAYEEDLRRGISDLTRLVCRNQETRARWHPQLIRTLLIDDCIERGREYCDGGARCNWSVINIVGLSNAADSLAAVKRAVFDERRFSASRILQALREDFVGHEDVRAYVDQCPRFGNDDPYVDAIAHRLSAFVYGEFQRYAPWRGGRFLCGTLMFVTYGWFGRPVGATPDGRRAGTPVADSAGPVQGRDRSGPTAMLRSVAGLDQYRAPGTLVVNLRLLPDLLRTPKGRARARALVETYFALGGMQMQINVVDQATLEDAIAHPEKHADLIVRVGGYSEYFNRLDDDLKRTILERTAHG